MMAWIGVGSNQGDRREHLERAIASLRLLASDKKLRLSPVFENPALLPDDCREEWNDPFLNLVVGLDFQGSPHQLLEKLQAIEAEHGRGSHQRWSPRPLDLDILFFKDNFIKERNLEIPHPHFMFRNFVLEPLKSLCPQWSPLGEDSPTILQWARQLPARLPLWMQIVNVTEDSFSDGGVLRSTKDFINLLNSYVDAGVHILDLGAESTRPGAHLVEPEKEWQKLRPFLETIRQYFGSCALKPLVSVDTRHPTTAKRAIDWGADIINDVSGLTSLEMFRIIADSNCDYILMHSLTVPADPQQHIPTFVDPVQEICHWLDVKLEELVRSGISLDRIIFDPGIGFGKTPHQSLSILRRFSEFQKYPVRLLVGHSRKSFMKSFSSSIARERDGESLGISLDLIKKGADILRVHNAVLHSQAFRGWSHVQ
jgi:2-amino-4-hydroxy-6-hydroxymethyldihydropteridine diphosphokinase/dihydropteroate synthase